MASMMEESHSTVVLVRPKLVRQHLSSFVLSALMATTVGPFRSGSAFSAPMRASVRLAGFAVASLTDSGAEVSLPARLACAATATGQLGFFSGLE